MNDNIIKAFNDFQIADLDDDMVGMCKSLVDWMKVLRAEAPQVTFPDTVAPAGFFKLDPHQPKMELRKNLRKMMAHVVTYQGDDFDGDTKIINIYVVILAATYIYHMPSEKMAALSLSSEEFTRDAAKKLLLEDNMSPNWLKDPSGRDFTAIML
jgi:hypothetical protein